jgi:hypothetical protein
VRRAGLDPKIDIAGSSGARVRGDGVCVDDEILNAGGVEGEQYLFESANIVLTMVIFSPGDNAAKYSRPNAS